MREIKFKAWDKRRKKFLRVNGIEFNHAGVITHITVFNPMPGIKLERLPRGDFELMQFTGRHDKNNKEIYRGNKIAFQVGYYKAKRNQTVTDTVVFEAGCFKTKKYKMPISAIPNCEIIGSIYEKEK